MEASDLAIKAQATPSNNLNEKKHKCEICDYTAARLFDLKRHRRTHTGEKPYKCDKCDHATTHKSALNIHYVSHFEEKPFECNLCYKTFKLNQNMAKHMKKHDPGERKFKCDKCDYTNYRLDSLKTHMLTHGGTKRFWCAHCDYRAVRISTLKQHLRVHMYANYICEKCEYKTANGSNFRRHTNKCCL